MNTGKIRRQRQAVQAAVEDMTQDERDALWMKAVGLYPGAPLPHPGDCGCSAHTASGAAIETPAGE